MAAADLAAERVAAVRDDVEGRLALLRSSYGAAVPGQPAPHARYPRSALAFMAWQARRGVLAGGAGAGGAGVGGDAVAGSPWWRAVNERLLRDTCEARLRLLGHPGPSSSPSVEASLAFARQPSPRSWYLAHNVTIVTAYLEHRDLAEAENRIERFFLNLILVRVLYAHALVAAPRLALGWLAPVAPYLGDPRRDATGRFLAVERVVPDRYPLDGTLEDHIAGEHPVGRALDLGIIVPRLAALYRWSADALAIPALASLVDGNVPTYAWEPSDSRPWTPPATRSVRLLRRALPA